MHYSTCILISSLIVVRWWCPLWVSGTLKSPCVVYWLSDGKKPTESTPSAISRIMVRTILLLAIVMAKVDLLILPKEFVSCNLKHFQNVNRGFSSLNSSYNWNPPKSVFFPVSNVWRAYQWHFPGHDMRLPFGMKKLAWWKNKKQHYFPRLPNANTN